MPSRQWQGKSSFGLGTLSGYACVTWHASQASMTAGAHPATRLNISILASSSSYPRHVAMVWHDGRDHCCLGVSSAISPSKTGERVGDRRPSCPAGRRPALCPLPTMTGGSHGHKTRLRLPTDNCHVVLETRIVRHALSPAPSLGDDDCRPQFDLFLSHPCCEQ